ncbi:ABC transporter ATP-binding protein [Conexibacter woesei]|uniref:ABC transporter related protein n=1 Tax=Conexibacter woesei (strain DSM 14684 / CCUG 47730 / CIP 108061 / JCM 11494 / NBRC 100937 / ID131577) TaxID=469383 RepID=D3F980_CONWI|nr:ABC transporter ATP-binding protein [Conexibacter woesei]ADB49047.1 ABC transporter related protein [Conexibacter woesei DSM 14684]
MPVIEVEHLRKYYGDVHAVEDVSFSVERGEIFGILGRNGAGKTTSVECVAGLAQRDGGRIAVLGHDPQDGDVALRERLGVQLQRNALPDKLRVGEALELYASFYREPADGDELLALLGLADVRDRAFDALSGGQQQRLSIALALVGRPEVAILDELTTGLDPAARRATWELIGRVRDRGVTIVLVTHFMEEAERLCDRVALIDAGRVVALDTPAGLAARGDREQRIRFRPERPVDRALLTALAPVTSVDRLVGGELIVGGGDGLLLAVVAALAEAGIEPLELRLEQSSLEDAFVALTGAQDAPAAAAGPAEAIA